MIAPLSILAQNLPIRWQAPWLLPAVLVLGAALAAAVLWFYPAQVKTIARPWRYLIPGLRLLAFMALAISIARPVALRARPVEDRGTLLILLDRSRSMSVADGGRRPAEWVSLADALGLLPVGVRAAATARVSTDFEQLQAAVGQAVRAQGDLDYARVSGRGIDAAEARVRKGVEEARAIGKALAERSASLPDESGLRDKLKPLGELPVADLRGGWIAETRRRLDQATAAIAGFQEQVDLRLFETDPVVRRICAELSHRSRFDLAAESIVRPGGLLSRLGPETSAVVYGFADRVTPIGVQRPAPASATQPAEAGDPGEGELVGPIRWTAGRLALKPDGTGTDIAGAITAAIAGSDDKPIRGVVVFGDGQQVGAESGGTNLLPPGVPLIAVATAGGLAPKDLSIVDVVAPPSAFVGETAVVRVRVKGTGGMTADASAVRLSLVGDDGRAELPPTIIDRPVDKPGGKKEEAGSWAIFSVKFEHPGVQELKLTLPSVEGEISYENNTARRWVKVLPERIRVAAYAGTAGWDFQYLRAALARREWFDVESAVLDPTAPKLPLSPAQILQQNVLVLYDMPVHALDREQWYAVDRLVTQRGGSVIFIAGPGFAPASYVEQPIASALLPFNFQADRKPAWRIWPGDRPSIRVVPAPEFARSDLLRLDDADTLNRRWQDLSGVYRVLPVKVLKPGARALLRDAETGAAVATEMRPGTGRAIYIGTHETWRWRYKSGETEHERFWRQLVRHAAEEPYADRRGRFALDVDRVAVAPGEPVQIRVRVLGDDEIRPSGGTPATQPAIPVERMHIELVDGNGATLKTVKLTESADGGRLRATMTDLPAGQFLVRLGADRPPVGVDWPHVPLRVEPSSETEMKNLAGDPDRLRRMAESTGGRLLRLDQLSTVPGLLSAAADDRPRVVEWSLWDSPWLFVFVVACFGAEWALRKRVGLA